MGRLWALALGIILALSVVFIVGPMGGATTMLTASLPIGAGAAAAYILGSGHTVARGMWLMAGVLIGAMGFGLGAVAFPDTLVGLYLGGAVPVLLSAIVTTWTRRQADFICVILGGGAMTGVYATRFNTDPQALNYLLPVAIGQALFPLALGFIAGSVVKAFVATDDEVEVVAAAEGIAKDTEVTQ